LLLIAAADPTGDPALLWRAAAHLGITGEAAAPAAEAGLITFGGRVVFRDHAVRSAVYRIARLRHRRPAHRALAQATDPGADPDRRAWHQAQALTELDEDVAADLERTASHAQARGGLAETLDDRWQARADHVRAKLAYAVNRGGEAAQLLLEAARQLSRLGGEQSRAAYLDAIRAALPAGTWAAPGATAADIAREGSPGADALLAGLAASFSG
jgi:hypothetical protein